MNINYLHASFIAAFTVFTLSACSDHQSDEQIPLTEVPENIITVVQNSLPGISLTKAKKEINDNDTTYELEGRLINGKEYEIKITGSGTIIKIELEN